MEANNEQEHHPPKFCVKFREIWVPENEIFKRNLGACGAQFWPRARHQQVLHLAQRFWGGANLRPQALDLAPDSSEGCTAVFGVLGFSHKRHNTTDVSCHTYTRFMRAVSRFPRVPDPYPDSMSGTYDAQKDA